MFLSLPATVALVIGSEEIISALFGYGSFSEKEVLNSAKALYYFGYGFASFCSNKSFFKFFFANHDTKTPFYIFTYFCTTKYFNKCLLFQDYGFYNYSNCYINIILV